MPTDEEPNRAELVPKKDDQLAKELEPFAAIVRGVFEPIADAERHKADLEDKQHERECNLEQSKFKWSLGAAGVVFVVMVGLVVLTYLRGDIALAANILVGLVSFIGGFGVGRTTRRPDE